MNCEAGEVAVYSITVNHIHRQIDEAKPVGVCAWSRVSPRTDAVFALGLNIEQGRQSKKRLGRDRGPLFLSIPEN